MKTKKVKKHDPWKSCESKVKYDTEASANASFRGSPPYPGARWTSYRCVHCRYWHVSSGVPK